MTFHKLAAVALVFALCVGSGAFAEEAQPAADLAQEFNVTIFTPETLDDPLATRKLLQTYYSGSGPYYNISVSCGSWSVSTPWSNSSGSYQTYSCANTTSGTTTTGTVNTNTATYPGGSSSTTTNSNGAWTGTSVVTPYSNTQVSCGHTSVSTPWYSGSWSYPGCGRRKLLDDALGSMKPSEVVVMMPSKALDPAMTRHLLQTFYSDSAELTEATTSCGKWTVISEYSDNSGTYTGYNCTTASS